ncbi:amidohydrolase [Luminiphilus sp.]|nr:amidohydrolase [Luminiphilus sp.]
MLKILKCSADKRWPASVGCIVATVLCVSATVAVAQEDCPESDLLLIDANIYTGGDDNTSHEALAIKDGVFSFIGSNDAASRWVCGARQVVSLDGSTVFPGFTDSHQHLEGIGRRTKTLSLFGTNTLERTVTEIEGWAAQIPAGQWVLGRGWIEREWVGERRFLTRWDVDPFTESKPLFMPRADGVSALVNSKALILAGITRETPDPAGGRFDRNNEGELTGYVLGNAMEPFRNLIPADTDAYVKDNLRRGMAVNASRGWTSTHDAGMSWRELRLLQELRYEGAMAHRVYVAVPIAQAGPLLEQGAEQSDDGLIDLGGVKVFIDGTLGSRGAALLEPYADANHNGFMNRTTKAELMPVLEGALRNGLQILTHVIGDRAVSVTLDWYQEAWDALPRGDWQREDLRWRLEHAQIIPIEDQQRLHDMNVIASMQPSHAIGDLNFAPARLGLERLQVAYPWRPLLERGVKIVGGSDAPVEAGDPRIEFYAAITRQRLDGTSGAGWHPEHAVSREDALRMFTLWPAYSIFHEERRGSISVGKQADLSIFDTDFLRAKPAAILTAKTVMTVVNGRIAYIADRSTDTPD